MSDVDDDLDGGDISSGFGVPKKGGPISDERAEQMLRARAEGKAHGESSFAVDPSGTVSEPEDTADEERPEAGGGGGGGGW